MTKQEYSSLFQNREIIIATITVASVIVSILFYVITLSSDQTNAIYLFDLVITGILTYDFIERMRKSHNYKKFLLQHFYEIPALLPLILFSFVEYESSTVAIFRALKIIRIFRLLRLLRLINLFKTAHYLKASGFIYLVMLFIVSIIFGAIGMFVVEQGNPNSTIKNFGDALWFALTTLTISGFGDVYPITFEGRIISAILILVGLTAILGFVSSFGKTLLDDRLNKKVIAHDIKKSVKDRIDILEQLHTPEVENLLNEINSLYKKIYQGNVSCRECGFIYPKESLYCNKCGTKIT
ncbi:MAG: potassium channel family protein [Thermoproteota archaeon]|nr:potassium channel family protein [Thermoproteota archaeon]